jgi:hydroxypyruvate isomerase
MRFSANLGFLFTDRPLPAAIRTAAAVGFDAVELHWPFENDPAEVRAVLAETGLPLLAVNTPRGDLAAGEFGLCALPGRAADARAAIDLAIGWAEAAGASALHLMAGRTAVTPAATEAFLASIAHAQARAEPLGISLLIEPINPFDVPGYFLGSLSLAHEIRACSGAAVKVMFDCYHLARMGVDLLDAFAADPSAVGHVQFAAVPDRGEPDHGKVDYAALLPELARAGHAGHFGAEYRPASGDMYWLNRLRSAAG